MTPYGEQGESGFDVSLLRENLKLTPTERIQELQKSLIRFEEVKRAGRDHRLSQRSHSILAEPKGVDNFEGLWARADTMEMFGLAVRVASIEDLIAMKRAANRPKDQVHILELLYQVRWYT